MSRLAFWLRHAASGDRLQGLLVDAVVFGEPDRIQKIVLVGSSGECQRGDQVELADVPDRVQQLAVCGQDGRACR